ncbi:MAG: hypothetical protein Ta2E_11710 [Mycoplasmoidaceae bacterium]|nr:MAG: hypothetical protein Ta2E_11710 [Mycoplasmoidaceae bacterium]
MSVINFRARVNERGKEMSRYGSIDLEVDCSFMRWLLIQKHYIIEGAFHLGMEDWDEKVEDFFGNNRYPQMILEERPQGKTTNG